MWVAWDVLYQTKLEADPWGTLKWDTTNRQSILKINEARYHGKRELIRFCFFIGQSQGDTNIPAIASKLNNTFGLQHKSLMSFCLFVFVLLFMGNFHTSAVLSVNYLHVLFPHLVLLFVEGWDFSGLFGLFYSFSKSLSLLSLSLNIDSHYTCKTGPITCSVSPVHSVLFVTMQEC